MNLAAVSADASGPRYGGVRIDDITDVFLWDRPGVGMGELLQGAWVNNGDSVNKAVVDLPDDVQEWVMGLLAHVQERYSGDDVIDFNVQHQVADEVHVFRGFRDETVEGTLLSMRRVAGEVPLLDDLLLPPWWKELIMQESLCRDGGLILLCAPNGRGKTTTLGASLRSRLEAYGGHARTVENPVELPLNGWHKEGVCVQKAVDTQDDERAFSRALRRTMARGFPAAPGNMLMVGEVRDADTASEVVKASVTGLLVFATVHGDSPIGAAQRLCAYAAGAAGSHDVVCDMVGSSFRLAMYQDMEVNPNPNARGWHRRIIKGDVLVSSGIESPVANAIRSGKFEQLNGMLDRQRNLVRSRKPPVRDHRRELAEFLEQAGTL